MKILGICNDETSSACLMVDGIIVSAVSEERFSRVKMDNSFPEKSIKFCLESYDLSLKDINIISYSWSKGIEENLLLKYVEKSVNYVNEPEDFNIFKQRIKWEISKSTKKINEFNDWVVKNIDQNKQKVVSYYHHEAHAASACIFFTIQ